MFDCESATRVYGFWHLDSKMTRPFGNSIKDIHCRVVKRGSLLKVRNVYLAMRTHMNVFWADRFFISAASPLKLERVCDKSTPRRSSSPTPTVKARAVEFESLVLFCLEAARRSEKDFDPPSRFDGLLVGRASSIENRADLPLLLSIVGSD